jgi:hypothetical protein
VNLPVINNLLKTDEQLQAEVDCYGVAYSRIDEQCNKDCALRARCIARLATITYPAHKLKFGDKAEALITEVLGTDLPSIRVAKRVMRGEGFDDAIKAEETSAAKGDEPDAAQAVEKQPQPALVSASGIVPKKKKAPKAATPEPAPQAQPSVQASPEEDPMKKKKKAPKAAKAAASTGFDRERLKSKFVSALKDHQKLPDVLYKGKTIAGPVVDVAAKGYRSDGGKLFGTLTEFVASVTGSGTYGDRSYSAYSVPRFFRTAAHVGKVKAPKAAKVTAPAAAPKKKAPAPAKKKASKVKVVKKVLKASKVKVVKKVLKKSTAKKVMRVRPKVKAKKTKAKKSKSK